MSEYYYLLPDFLFSPQAFSVFYAGLVGLIIGFEREMRGKNTSIRTFSLISTGSCIFTLISVNAAEHLNAPPFDVTRVAAQIVSGVGFLGAGVIFKTHNRIEGVTTAALIWLTAALGVAIGFGMYDLVICAFIVAVTVHAFSRLLYATLFRRKRQPSYEEESE